MKFFALRPLIGIALAGMPMITGRVAAVELGEDPTLNEYIAYAIDNNAGLAAAHDRWMAEVEDIAQSKSLPNPTLSYAYYVDSVETRVGPQEHKIGVTQMLPWFGILGLRGDMAAEAANVARGQADTARLRLRYDVTDAFFEYYYLSRSISITENNIQLLTRLEGVAQAKYKAGAPLSGVIKSQVELSKLEDRLKSLRDMKRPFVAKLNGVLGRPHDAPLPWPSNVAFTDRTPDEERVFSVLVESSPELKTLSATMAKAERAVELARKNYFPNIMLGVSYIETGEALNRDTADSGKDPVIAMVAIDLPIWQGKYRSAEREARWRRDAARRMLQDRENMLQSRLAMAVYGYRDSERKIDLYRDTLIPQAQQSLNVTEEAYRAGQADIQGLIDAERMLLDFQLSYERARTDREQRLAEIEMLVGEDLSTEVKP